MLQSYHDHTILGSLYIFIAIKMVLDRNDICFPAITYVKEVHDYMPLDIDEVLICMSVFFFYLNMTGDS